MIDAIGNMLIDRLGHMGAVSAVKVGLLIGLLCVVLGALYPLVSLLADQLRRQP